MFTLQPIYLFAGIPLVAVLGWILYRRHSAALLDQITRDRRATSTVVGRATFVDGARQIPVAVSLTESMFFYENPSMHASLERKWIDEVEYEDELTTGRVVANGTVLRLRCSSTAFEFVLDGPSAADWKATLPAHRAGATP